MSVTFFNMRRRQAAAKGAAEQAAPKPVEKTEAKKTAKASK